MKRHGEKDLRIKKKEIQTKNVRTNKINAADIDPL